MALLLIESYGRKLEEAGTKLPLPGSLFNIVLISSWSESDPAPASIEAPFYRPVPTISLYVLMLCWPVVVVSEGAIFAFSWYEGLTF